MAPADGGGTGGFVSQFEHPTVEYSDPIGNVSISTNDQIVRVSDGEYSRHNSPL